MELVNRQKQTSTPRILSQFSDRVEVINRGAGGGVHASGTRFPPAKRAVVWCVVEIKHSKNTGHLVEVVLGFTETLFEFDTVQDQRELSPLGVPVRAGAAGTSGSSTCCLARFRHIQASHLSDAISPDSVYFWVNLAEYYSKSV